MLIFPFKNDVRFTVTPKMGDRVLTEADMQNLKVSVINEIGRSVRFEPRIRWVDSGIEIEIQRENVPHTGMYRVVLDWRLVDSGFSDGFKDMHSECVDIEFRPCVAQDDESGDVIWIPPVAVDLAQFAKSGGSEKTVREIDEKLTEIDEGLNEKIAQLAGATDEKITQLVSETAEALKLTAKHAPLVDDPRFKGLIDCFYGSENTRGATVRIIQMSKSNGRIIVRENNDGMTLNYDGEKIGVKLHRIGSESHYIWILVNWDAVGETYDPDSETAFTVDSPVTPELRSLFAMLMNGEYKVRDNVTLNSYEIPVSFNCLWADGTEGTVTHSAFDNNVLEYTVTKATYKGIGINYGAKTFDNNGFIINQLITTIW